MYGKRELRAAPPSGRRLFVGESRICTLVWLKFECAAQISRTSSLLKLPRGCAASEKKQLIMESRYRQLPQCPFLRPSHKAHLRPEVSKGFSLVAQRRCLPDTLLCCEHAGEEQRCLLPLCAEGAPDRRKNLLALDRDRLSCWGGPRQRLNSRPHQRLAQDYFSSLGGSSFWRRWLASTTRS